MPGRGAGNTVDWPRASATSALQQRLRLVAARAAKPAASIRAVVGSGVGLLAWKEWVTDRATPGEGVVALDGDLLPHLQGEEGVEGRGIARLAAPGPGPQHVDPVDIEESLRDGKLAVAGLTRIDCDAGAG